MTEENFLTPLDVALRLRVSRSLVYRLLATGEIPWHRVRSRKRVDPADLEAYLDQNRVEPAKLPRATRRHF